MKRASAPSRLGAYLDALIAGRAPKRAGMPDDECLEISSAIAKCAEASMSHAPWGRARPDAIPLHSTLLPPLP